MWNLDVTARLTRVQSSASSAGGLAVRVVLAVLAPGMCLAAGCTTVDPAVMVPEDASPVVLNYADECRGGVMTGCYALGLAWEVGEESGHGLERNLAHASRLLTRACEGGITQACDAAAAIAEGSSPGPSSAPEGMNALEGSGE
jgi:hypothetical protein